MLHNCIRKDHDITSGTHYFLSESEKLLNERVPKLFIFTRGNT